MKCSCGITPKSNICLCGLTLFELKVKPVKGLIKKPIKKVSERRKQQNAEYKKLRIQFLLDNPRCEVFPELASSEVHHGAGRIEDLLCDMSTWKAVSRRGHQKIELFPEWAKSQGFSMERLKTTI